MTDEDDPGGSGDSVDVDEGELRTDEPAAWKLNSCTFMADQSVTCVVAACSRKAWS